MTPIALIWDLDGTLIDSYPAIIEAMTLLHEEWGLPFDEPRVKDFILKESVGQYLTNLAQEHGLDLSHLQARFLEEQEKRDHMIRLLPFAQQVLAFAKSRGMLNLMYTHKGATTEQVLSDLGILSYFTEVLTAVSGFARKPNPEAIDYLLAKYQLQKEKTYYIGDRQLDVDTAKNAGIKSLNLHIPDGVQQLKMANLEEVKSYLESLLT